MADRTLPVAETSKKLTSNASVPNMNFKLQLDMYSSQRTPSVSPTSLSDEPEEGLISLIRKEEVPVVSRNSSTSSSVDENLSQLGSSVENKGSEVDVDSEGGLLNDNEIIREVPDCSMKKHGYTCGICGLVGSSLRDHLYHQKSAHDVKISIQECAICDFATSTQQKLIEHQRVVHSLNKVVDSHSSTEAACLEGRDDHILTSPNLNSAQRNSTYIKKEAEDKEDDNCDTPMANGASTSLANTTDTVDEEFDDKKVKKKTRQEVNPSKYFEVVGGSISKFACSMCGKIYKWKKSLNKHWNEKHNFELLLNAVNCPGLAVLLEDGNYTLVEERILCETAFLRQVKVTESDNLPLTSSPASYSSHHSDMLNKSTSLPPLSRSINELTTPHLFFPGNSVAVPQFPVQNIGNDPSEEEILDLTYGCNQSSGTHQQDRTLPSVQAQPLNLSVKELPQCSKSDSSFHYETEPPGCITSQKPKNVIICFECKAPMKFMNVLNKHFKKDHIQVLLDYKEAFKKIPHGLQQSYHLLDMDISEVVELSNHNLDRVILKCKNCGFEAKGAADLQMHTGSHAEERPHICMVCGASYKLKWDLVKHFSRSHGSLPHPYKRNDRKDTSNESSEEDGEQLPKKRNSEENKDKMDSSRCTRNGDVSMEGIFEASPEREASLCQQNGFDPVIPKLQTVPRVHKNMTYIEGTHVEQIALTDQKNDRFSKTHRAKTLPYIPQTSQESGSWQANRTTAIDSETAQGLKPEQYKCIDCGLQFSLLSALKKHSIMHKQHKPYKCVYCEYRSKWKWDVAKHIKRCSRGGQDRLSQQNTIGKKGRDKSKYRQPTFACTSQSINENASPSCTEALDSFPKADPKAKSKKRKSSSNANGSYNHAALVNQNNIAQTNDLQATGLKEAIETTSKRNASSSSCSPIAPRIASQPQNRNSGQIPSAEVWKCFHCAFTTHSQAELKRHSSIHSEVKPFKCDKCIYSSKWPCDLKKHRKLYNHFPQTNDNQEIEDAQEEFQPRFKCSHCIIYFGSLQELADHHITEHAAKELNQTFTMTLMEDVVDMARIKHPRKHGKHISCSHCPFVDTSLQIMVTHLSHDIHCCYCKSMFTNKESFFDHLTTHEEFTPKEWEPYFMISETEQQLIKYAKKANQRATNKTLGKHTARERNQNGSKFNYGYNVKSTTGTDPSPFRVQPIEGEKSGQVLAPRKRVQLNMYTCEWCLAEFTSLTAVYDHARRFHLIQLNEQAAEMPMADGANPQMTPHIDDMNVEEGGYSLTDKHAQKFVSAAQDATNEEMVAKKINFSSRSATHEQRNGTKKFQCHFCELSVDNVNLLQRHMKISHGRIQPALKLEHNRINSASSSTGILPDCDSFPCTSQDFMDVSFDDEKTFSCSLCPFKTNTAKMMNGHVVNHMIQSDYQCHTCNFSSHSVAGMNAHSKVHEKGYVSGKTR